MDQQFVTHTRCWRALCVVLALALLGVASCASNSPVAMAPLDDARLILINVDLPESSQVSVGSGGKSYAGAGYAVPLQATQTLAAVAGDYHLERLESWPIAALSLHCGLVRVSTGVDVDKLLQRLQQDSRVRLAQRVNRFETLGNTAAAGHNDPYFVAQFDEASPIVARLHEFHRGEGSTVAIVDTGADIHHPDLANQIVAARNFVDDDETQFLRDIHGTAVAGIVAAEADNGLGIVGVAPDARLQILKACWQINAEGDARCNTFTLAKALAFVFEVRPDVVNLSLAGPSDPLLSQLLARVVASGSVVVGAVSPTLAKSFPTEVAGVVAVSQNPVRDTAVITAPGSERLSTRPRDSYDFYSGNSVAAAYVSAVAALLRADDPSMVSSTLADLLHQPDASCVVQSLLAENTALSGECP